MNTDLRTAAVPPIFQPVRSAVKAPATALQFGEVDHGFGIPDSKDPTMIRARYWRMQRSAWRRQLQALLQPLVNVIRLGRQAAGL